MGDIPLPPELGSQGVPGEEQSMTPASDALRPLTEGDPLGDFVNTLIQLVESKGLDLDELMRGDSIEDQADVAEDPDPLELLTEEEIVMIMEKFIVLSPEQQATMEQELSKILPPKTINRLKAALRFTQQRTA